MATQKIYYRKSDLTVQYIDYYTTSQSSASTGPNISDQAELFGYLEADVYGNFVASLDYSSSANCTYFNDGTTYVADFYAARHKYSCNPTAKTIWPAGSIIPTNFYHYGIWYVNREGEALTTVATAGNQGFITVMRRYSDDITAAAVSAYFGKGQPYTKAVFGQTVYSPGMGPSQLGTWGNSVFLDKRSAAAYTISNNGYYDQFTTSYNPNRVSYDVNGNVNPANVPAGVTRLTPTLTTVTAPTIPGSIGTFRVGSISSTCPCATELVLVAIEQSAQTYAWNGNGDYVDSAHAWVIHAVRSAPGAAWTGTGVTASDAGGDYFTVSGSFGSVGTWSVSVVEGYYNKPSIPLSVSVTQPSQNDYLIYALANSTDGIPTSASTGFVTKITVATVPNGGGTPAPDQWYFGKPNALSVSSSGTSGAGSNVPNRGISWFCDRASPLGASLNSTGYAAFTAGMTTGAGGNRYCVQAAGQNTGTLTLVSTPVATARVAPSASFAPGQNITSVTPAAWYRVDFLTLAASATCKDLQFRFVVRQPNSAGSATYDAYGMSLIRNGSNWPAGDAGSGQVWVKPPTAPAAGYKFRVEVLEGYSSLPATATNTLAGVSEYEVETNILIGGYYAFFTGASSAAPVSPATAYMPKALPWREFTDGNIVHIMSGYPPHSDQHGTIGQYNDPSNYNLASGWMQYWTFGGDWSEASGRVVYVPNLTQEPYGSNTVGEFKVSFANNPPSGEGVYISPVSPNYSSSGVCFTVVEPVNGGFLPYANFSMATTASAPTPINGSLAATAGYYAYKFAPSAALNATIGVSGYAILSPGDTFKAKRLHLVLNEIIRYSQNGFSWPSFVAPDTGAHNYKCKVIFRDNYNLQWEKPTGTYWAGKTVDTFGFTVDLTGVPAGDYMIRFINSEGCGHSWAYNYPIYPAGCSQPEWDGCIRIG